MLVKITKVDSKKVNVIQLDIDDYGSVIPLRELELTLPAVGVDDSVYKILKNAEYAALFTRQDYNNEKKIKNAVVILANPITLDVLNSEKNRVIVDSSKKKDEN